MVAFGVLLCFIMIIIVMIMIIIMIFFIIIIVIITQPLAGLCAFLHIITCGRCSSKFDFKRL